MILLFTFAIILTHLDNHFINSDSFHHSLQVGMFCIIDCFSGMGVNIGAFISKVAYGCSLGIKI